MFSKRNTLIGFLLIAIPLTYIAVFSSFNSIIPNINQITTRDGFNFSLRSSLLDDWNKTWNKGDDEYGRGITIDEETGDLYVVGYNSSTNYDIILIKYDNLGQELWNITWDDGRDEFGYDIALDSQKNIYISGGNGTGFPDYDALLLKFNNAGGFLWKRYYDGGSYDGSWALTIDSNDNIYMISESILVSSYDTVLLKYNSSGDLQWTTVFDGSLYQSGHDIVLDDSNNIYVGGLEGLSPDFNYLLIKFDDQGNHLWNRTWGGSGNDQGWALGVDLFNNVYISGFSTSYGALGKDIVLIKYDGSGNLLWNESYGTINDEEAYAIAFDSAGYIYIGGHRVLQNITIVKFDSEGNFIWDNIWELYPQYRHWCYDLIIDLEDNLYFTGAIAPSIGVPIDMIIVKQSIQSPGGFNLFTDADNPDTNGIFNLNWTDSSRVNNYSLYYSNISCIIDVETDVPWVESILNNGVEVSFDNGTYYFLAVAQNNFGYALSNCVSVTVGKTSNGPPNGNGEEPPIPGYNLLILIALIGVTSALIAKKRLKN